MQKNQARFCPTEKQLAGGQNAILKIVDSLADEHLEVDAVHVLFSSELFSPHDSGQRMRSILAKNKRSLSIEVAYYWILSYAIESNNSQPVYEGQNTWDYIKDYAQHFSGISAYSQVVRAFVIALHQGKISKDNFQATITSILANPTVTISEKLTIEQTLFSEGML